MTILAISQEVNDFIHEHVLSLLQLYIIFSSSTSICTVFSQSKDGANQYFANTSLMSLETADGEALPGNEVTTIWLS